ncbi:MAG: HIT family protein [Rhizobiaceae bacterium]
MSGYDPNNIFARILRGEMPCHKVYEDELTLVLMDIFPRCDGHCLVLPKSPARNILDVDTASLEAVARTTQKIARAAMKAFSADGVSVTQANEAAGNQEVFHLHVHVLPRHAGVSLARPASSMAAPEKLAGNAAKIRAALEA